MPRRLLEVWRPVIGFGGLYLISNLGHLKSFNHSRVGRLIKPFPTKKGERYGYVDFRRGGKRYRVAIHDLVLTHFHGPRTEGLQCRHLDNDPTNNWIGNLVWGTALENGIDRRGWKHTEEWKKQTSARQLGHTVTAKTRRKIAQSLLGHPVSPKARQLISQANRGYKHTPESRLKIVQAVRARRALERINGRGASNDEVNR